MPSTVEEYLAACQLEGVWVSGIQWMRAVSFLFNVRVAVIIYGQPLVRLFGEGEKKIYLYMVLALVTHLHFFIHSILPR